MTNLNVLVVGASGFPGRRVAVALGRRGHRVLRAGRDPLRLSLLDPFGEVVRADLARDGVADWSGRLDGIDAVVNAAGALRGDLAALHADGPRALFEACAATRIPRVVQVSALGAGQPPGSPFLATKSRGDAVVLHHAGDRSGWHVVRPSLVIGRCGRSTATFSALAAAPRPIRLGAGTWHVQPIRHVTKRKISGGTRSDNGRAEWARAHGLRSRSGWHTEGCRDTFLGLAKTCRKLGVSFWDYLGDRRAVPAGIAVTPLPSLVRKRAAPA